MPPKPATNNSATPIIETRLAQIIDVWLERISSFSMIGKPVRPILVSGCRACVCAINSRSASVASLPRVKLSLRRAPTAAARSRAALAWSAGIRSSARSSMANDCGISGQGD